MDTIDIKFWSTFILIIVAMVVFSAFQLANQKQYKACKSPTQETHVEKHAVCKVQQTTTFGGYCADYEIKDTTRVPDNIKVVEKTEKCPEGFYEEN